MTRLNAKGNIVKKLSVLVLLWSEKETKVEEHVIKQVVNHYAFANLEG
jgi:hypothetical protein